jgi:hypothetical protein
VYFLGWFWIVRLTFLQENANSVGTVQLAHSLAHSLPPPGYNRQRPHCMVLTMANGGVFFFQAGTEELVSEWVSTCNYWAARTSKEPLAGGVSNMEYGWNRITDALSGRSVSDEHKADYDRTDSTSVRSGRSARSKLGWKDGATVRNPPWADRVLINDWKPPIPPSISSIHDEEAQLEALQKYVHMLKKDLKDHNELREPMAALVCLADLPHSHVTHLYFSIHRVQQTERKLRPIGRGSRNSCSRRS